MRATSRDPPRGGFTLVELFVVLAVVALLLALLLPAVQRARAAARLVTCRSHLRQIGIATHSYIETYERFPGEHHPIQDGCLYSLLPYMEQQAVFLRTEAIRDGSAKSESIPVIPAYLCPDDPMPRSYDVASYAINKGLLKSLGHVRGFVFGPVRLADITDGLSQTAFFSERATNSWRPFYLLMEPTFPLWRSDEELRDLAARCAASRGTISPVYVGESSERVLSSAGGYNHLLPPNAPACQFTPYPGDVRPPVSGHAQGVNVLYADGSVRFTSESIDSGVWWSLGTIDSGDSVGE